MIHSSAVQHGVYPFKEKHSLPLRIWHWTTALVIAGSLITVLFGSIVFTTRGNISMIQEQVQSKGGTVSTVQARAVAHEYSDKLWMLHKYIGYGLCFLLIGRMVVEFAHSKEEKLTNKLKRALFFRAGNADKRVVNHYLLVKGGYIFFYCAFIIMVISGLGLAYEDVPFLRSIHKPLIQVHGFTQYLIYSFILFHVIGVVRAEVTDSKGIVSGMINGSAS